MAKLEQEAYRLAVSALEQQERALTELRARTGSLLTVSSLLASFLGGQVLLRASLSIWLILALAAFSSSIILCIYVLLPKDNLVFALDGPNAYEALYEIRDDQKEIDRRLAYWLESFREANHSVIRKLRAAFELAGFALFAEIGFLASALMLR